MVTLAIPICFVMTLGFMYFAGVTLNILTMMGLLLAVGMLVDNAVVVVESIYQEREKVPGRPKLASIIGTRHRSEEHTSELQSLMRISYAVFCLTKKINTN